MNKVNVLITDKTGTITEGKPSVEKVFAIHNIKRTCCNSLPESIQRASFMPRCRNKKNIDLVKQKTLRLLQERCYWTVKGKKGRLGNKKVNGTGRCIYSTELETVLSQSKKGKQFLYCWGWRVEFLFRFRIKVSSKALKL
jgi:Cu2+-exporting ATPase